MQDAGRATWTSSRRAAATAKIRRRRGDLAALDAAARRRAVRATAARLRARGGGAEVLGIFGTAPRLEPIDAESEARVCAPWDLIAQWLSETTSVSREVPRLARGRDGDTAQTINGTVKLGKKVLGDADAGGVEWGAWRSLKDTIDGFKKTMPLIMDLRNPAIRDRHWEQVMRECGETFDPHGDAFTLGRVTDLKLHLHDEFIAELSSNATKELAIENSLSTIQETWTTLKMDMVPYKEGRDVYKLQARRTCRGAGGQHRDAVHDEGRRFSRSRCPSPPKRKLLLVSEMLDLVTKVQTAWMYPENIFVGSEDIRKQLPLESVMFDDVDAAFTAEMRDRSELCRRRVHGSTPTRRRSSEKTSTRSRAWTRAGEDPEIARGVPGAEAPAAPFTSSARRLARDSAAETRSTAAAPRHVRGRQEAGDAPPGRWRRRNYVHDHARRTASSPFDEEVPTPAPGGVAEQGGGGDVPACKTSLRETLEQSKGMKKEKW